MSLRVARLDPSLAAVVVRRVPMLYNEGADASVDRPAHVRAGSACAWVEGAGLVVAQDDASFLAVVDPETGRARAVPLPAGPGGARQFDEGRGNKSHKLDLEACFTHEGVFYALGSGSTPARRRVVTWRPGRDPAVVALDAFYASLEALEAFAGAELNVEGAAVVGSVLRLFNRGNGRAPARDATCDVPLDAFVAHVRGTALAPPPGEVVAYALGDRLTFTDATPATTDAQAVLYLGAAEASPDVTRDGPVNAVAVGVIDAGGARYAHLTDTSGARVLDKAEGIALVPGPGASVALRALVVVDRDAPDIPSDLCIVDLSGPWLARERAT